MGQQLEKPILAKDSSSALPNNRPGLAWCATDMQGWRSGMEDAHICLPELPAPWDSVAMFGVLDGHGGEQVAKFSKRHLPEELHSCLCKTRPMGHRAVPESDLRQALTHSFHEMDELLRSGNYAAELKALTNPPCRELTRPMPVKNGPVDCNMVGCTCNICCITDEYILCANAGDSRAVLCRGGVAVPLSEDHKPNSDIEMARIKKAGGYVETQQSLSGCQYRVNGNLNLSRALGDLEYKKDRRIGPEEQIICATPDFICERRHPDDEFIVICCDGVWDVQTNQEVVDFVRARLCDRSESMEAPENVMEELLDACVSPDLRQTKGLGGDNMTAVLIRLPLEGSPPSSCSSRKTASSNGVSHSPEAAEVAKLLSVQVQANASNTGVLVVRLSFGALPVALCSIVFGCCEHTGDLEVSLAGSLSPQKFSLQAHMPKGSELYSSAETSVDFFPKSNLLRATLPWRQASPK